MAETRPRRIASARLIRFDADISYAAFRTPLDGEMGRWLSGALTRLYGVASIRIRTSGGSIPISPFVETLGVPAVTVPTVDPDNNQHSPNENLRATGIGACQHGQSSDTAGAAPPRPEAGGTVLERDEIMEDAVSNVVELIEGRLSGVRVVRSGGGVWLEIRGSGTSAAIRKRSSSWTAWTAPPVSCSR